MSSEPIQPKERRLRGKSLRIGVAVVVAVAILVIGLLAYKNHRDTEREQQLAQQKVCGPGVTKIAGAQECVGVSDGRYHFTLGDPAVAAALEKVQAEIQLQNDAVRSALHLTIAYALPMPWQGAGAVTPASVLHHLQGAYAAQSSANKKTAALKVRLEVANFGHEGIGWQQVANDLTDPKRAEPVTVVAGLGQSLETTQSLVKAVSAAGIPMVGSTITADDLNGHTYPNLYRVAPNNSQQIAAAISYLDRTIAKADLDRINGVYLIASGKTGDAYVRELTETFRAAVKHPVTYTYDPGEVGSEQALTGFAGNICSARPAAVYFAGRSAELRTFMTQLGAQCDPRAVVSVMAGDDATNMISDPDTSWGDVLKGGITLTYTGLAHPRAWGGKQFPQMVQLTDNLQLKDITPDFSDGTAMMAFDAVTLSVQAALRVAGPAPQPGKRGTLVNGFAHYNQDGPWCGASGAIALVTEETPQRGDVLNKPIPIVRLLPDHKTQFKTLYYPSGAPLPHCSPR